MKISIGILAHNETALIRQTIDSLLKQSLCQTLDPAWEIEVICVPNGCSDDTAQLAQTALTQMVTAVTHPRLTWQVCELTQPGKPNAWNHYVHEFANPQADYFILMDADIEFVEVETLERVVNLLEDDRHAWVAVDQPLKDIVFKQNKNIAEHISTFVSELSGNGSAVWLTGSLYCARREILHQIYMPTELTADDSFLYQMVTTNCLTTPCQPDRIVRATQASHVFEAYTSPAVLLRHECWLVMANITNDLIFKHLHNQLPSDAEMPTAGQLCRQWDQQNPHWVKQLIQVARRQQSGWLSPSQFLMRRFINLRYKSWINAILLSPLALVATIIDLMALYFANRALASSRSD
jgi:Glycosyl transferase family 2